MKTVLTMLLTNKLILLMNIIFCHLFADFILQGNLAEYKQKEWWKKNAPNDLYRYDYKVALFIHGFMWAFVTFLPCWIYECLLGKIRGLEIAIWMVVLCQAYVHAAIDDLKANRHAISLLVDQFLHLIQIIITWISIISINAI